jgi:hypothetical protein
MLHGRVLRMARSRDWSSRKVFNRLIATWIVMMDIWELLLSDVYGSRLQEVNRKKLGVLTA